MQPKVLNANLIQALRQKQLFNKDDHVIVAVSGGEDSLNLLYWMINGNLPSDLQPQVSAVYVNHQLRLDSDTEEQFVHDVFANTKGLTHAIQRRLDWQQQPKTGLEEVAREGRYAILKEVAHEIGATVIMTAHHQDDQAETILYKLIRGSRLSQLQGMQDCIRLDDDLRLVRPFLGLSKDSIRILNKHVVTDWVDDNSNEDVSFARNRIRHEILPEMSEINSQAVQHLIDLSQQLAGQQALLNPVLNAQAEAISNGTFNWQLPMESVVLILQHWIAKYGQLDISDRQLEQVVQLMRNPNTNRGEIMLRNGRKFVRQGSILKFLDK